MTKDVLALAEKLQSDSQGRSHRAIALALIDIAKSLRIIARRPESPHAGYALPPTIGANAEQPIAVDAVSDERVEPQEGKRRKVDFPVYECESPVSICWFHHDHNKVDFPVYECESPVSISSIYCWFHHDHNNEVKPNDPEGVAEDIAKMTPTQTRESW